MPQKYGRVLVGYMASYLPQAYSNAARTSGVLSSSFRTSDTAEPAFLRVSQHPMIDVINRGVSTCAAASRRGRLLRASRGDSKPQPEGSPCGDHSEVRHAALRYAATPQCCDALYGRMSACCRQ